MTGCFVVLEGLDGVGKTTQVALLSAWLDATEVAHIVVREPGGTPVGETIRELVLKRTPGESGDRESARRDGRNTPGTLQRAPPP